MGQCGHIEPHDQVNDSDGLQVHQVGHLLVVFDTQLLALVETNTVMMKKKFLFFVGRKT